jgi:hypothetical protein
MNYFLQVPGGKQEVQFTAHVAEQNAILKRLKAIFLIYNFSLKSF